MTRDGDASPRALDSVRSDLRRLGYLDDRVERFLLQDALKPERPAKAILPLTAKVAALVGVPITLASTLALAMVNGHLRHSPFDVLPLFFHLLLPVVLVVSAVFLVLAVLFTGLLRITHLRRIESASLALAVAAAVASMALVWSEGRAVLATLTTWQVVGLGLLLPVIGWAVFHGVHGALLALAIRLTDLAPEQPPARGRWVILGLALATLLGMLPAALDAGRVEATAPSALASTPAGPVVVIGVDGVLPEDVDYLLASGELPELARLADTGTVVSHRRGSEPPIAFWATVATGVRSPFHGMDTVDTFQPAGMSRPLRHIGALRRIWPSLVPSGLVDYRPVLANNRRVWSFWELAARGGGPALVVGWWGTFPVEPLPGVVVAHGAHQLLIDGIDGAVDPPSRSAELSAMARRAEPPPGLAAGLERVLGAEAEPVIDGAVRPDHFQLEAFRRLYAELSPRTGALYLPAVDIAIDLAELGSVGQAELARWQLTNVDTLLRDLAPRPETVVVIFDPGRRSAAAGRTLIWRRGGCRAPAPGSEAPPAEVSSAAVGAMILRSHGLPQSLELETPPALCSWPAAAPEVASYGVRRPTVIEVEDSEYLESLQALGYL